MNKSALTNKTSIIYYIIAAAYTLVDMLAFSKKSAFFFIFWIISVAVILLQVYLISKQNPDDNSLSFLKLPVLLIGNVYMAVQIIWSFIANILSLSKHLQGATIIIQGLLIAAFFIAVTAFSKVKENAQTIKDSNREATIDVKKWAVTMQSIYDNLKNTENADAAKKLFDEIKYANPRSNADCYEEEKAIKNKLDNLLQTTESAKLSENGTNIDLKSEINDIITLVKQRNKMINTLR